MNLSRSLQRRQAAILGFLSVATVLLLWELASAQGWISSRFASSPTGVIQAGLREVQLIRFWRDVQTSTIEFAAGYALAVVLGVPLGLVIGWYRRLSYALEPFMNFWYATPRITLVPLLALWLGLGISSKIAVVFLGAFVVILLNTYHGVRTTDPKFVAVARVFGASQVQFFRSVVLPSSFGFILAGLQLGVGRATIGVFVAEIYAAQAGLGVMIRIASNNFQVDRVIFGTLVFILLGLLAVGALRVVARRVAPWHADLLHV